MGAHRRAHHTRPDPPYASLTGQQLKGGGSRGGSAGGGRVNGSGGGRHPTDSAHLRARAERSERTARAVWTATESVAVGEAHVTGGERVTMAERVLRRRGRAGPVVTAAVRGRRSSRSSELPRRGGRHDRSRALWDTAQLFARSPLSSSQTPLLFPCLPLSLHTCLRSSSFSALRGPLSVPPPLCYPSHRGGYLAYPPCFSFTPLLRRRLAVVRAFASPCCGSAENRLLFAAFFPSRLSCHGH